MGAYTLGTDEHVEFEKYLIEVQDFGKITDFVGGTNGIKAKPIKINRSFTTCITLFRSITTFCRTDNILWNIPHT